MRGRPRGRRRSVDRGKLEGTRPFISRENRNGGTETGTSLILRLDTTFDLPFAAAGTLDASFDGDGKAVVNAPPGTLSDEFRTVIQSDGKIVAAGYVGGDVAVVRFNPDGSLDTSFDADGIAVTDFGGDNDRALDVTVQPDGKIVVAGSSRGVNSLGDVIVGRYNTNGTLDPSFSGDGKAVVKKTPVVPATGRRFGCNMISAISNLGRLSFMVFGERLTAGVFAKFLDRLLRADPGRKLFLIVDGHPAHRAARVKAWAAGHAGRVELFYLPGYSPELNPDELLNQDTKQAMRKTRPFDQRQMMAQVRGHLRSRQKRPAVVRRFFQEQHVRYAAA